MKFGDEYKRIMSKVPEPYKIKNTIVISLTHIQILSCLKIFIQQDKGQEGWMKVTSMVEIIRDFLGFRASEKEIELILRAEYEEEFTQVELKNELVNFSIFIHVVDILKREKLVLHQLGKYLNYIIFFVLMMLIVIYISLFYSYNNSTS